MIVFDRPISEATLGGPHHTGTVVLVGVALIAGFLFQTAPTDFGALAGISLTLIGATLLASFLPARRATRVDPMAALRSE